MAIEAPAPSAPAASASMGAPLPALSCGRKRKLGETVDHPIALENSPTSTPVKPKTRATAKAKAKAQVVDLIAAEDGDDNSYAQRIFGQGDAATKNSENGKAMGKGKKKADNGEEKRPRKFRACKPKSCNDIFMRALTQRMFVIDRVRDTSDPECPTETLTIAGTTGNVYTITIGPIPSCNCPHAMIGNQCKHIIYAMVHVLKAPEELQYQLGLLRSELRTIFAQAPPIPTADANAAESDGNRKPIAEDDDCPICCMPFIEARASAPKPHEIVYCKAACGNNVHKECFEQWAATKKDTSGVVTCPFCRTPWKADQSIIKRLAQTGAKNGEGYVNVAGELGLSGRRDYSTYHQFWVRRQARNRVDVSDAYFDDFDDCG